MNSVFVDLKDILWKRTCWLNVTVEYAYNSEFYIKKKINNLGAYIILWCKIIMLYI